MIEQRNRGAIRVHRANYAEPLLPGRIDLVSPVDGEVTPPLQLHSWPDISGRSDDRSFPRAVTFAWEAPAGEMNPLCYDLVIAADARFQQVVTTLRGLRETRAEVYNLCVGTPYYWRVIARRYCDLEPRLAGASRALAKSRPGYFVAHPAPPRWIYVPGVTNVRDIGGWELPGGARIRQGMIYRGSEMNSHCSILPKGRDVLIEDLGIRTDLDLRGLGEDCTPVLDPQRVEYVNIPVESYDAITNPEYTRRYRALFSLLATPSKYPIFLHCWGGADRTGTIVFLIEALLGMRNEDLFTDYELTSLSIWGERLRGFEAFQDLLQTLELFASTGSSLQYQVERYLKVIGNTDAEIARIREILTEIRE